MLKQKIIINICTYKRPLMLKACLDSLMEQQVPPDWNVEILVVDNDANKTARPLIENYLAHSKFPISYFCEEKQGISFARNRCCDESLEKSVDWLLFMDDDETAAPNWFMAYYEASQIYHGDVYSGPVRYIFPLDYADWLGNKGDTDTPDGTFKKRASTNNAFVNKIVLEQNGFNLRFDNNLAYTGGEDTDFFIRYEKMGGKIIHVSQAIVVEEVTQNRLTITWRLKRQLSSSTNRVYVNKKIMGTSKAIILALKEFLRHSLEGSIGLLISPIFVLKGKNIFKRKYYHALRHLAKGVGSLTGIFNMQPEPYKSPDGF